MDEKKGSEIPSDSVDDKGNEVKAEVKLLGEKDEKHEKDHKQRAPIDRFYVVYVIFIIHGIGVLMPWNMFITANDYFVNYKLAEIKPNGTSVEEEGEKTLYQIYFLGFLGFVAQIPTVILNGVNAFSHGLGGSTSRRITWSIIVVVVMFVFTIVLAMVDSSGWPPAFFWLTMASVVILNMANGIYQNSIFGTAACLPMKYPNAVIVGSNISGTLTSIIMILSKVSAPDVRTSAIYYFLTAIFILLAAFDTFYVLQYIPFYRHYSSKSSSSVPQQQGNTVSSRPPYWEIFKKSWVHDISCFLVFFVTLSVFPALQANIRPSDPNFFISDEYYSPVTCFLFFNLFALLGSITSDFIKKPGPRWVWIPVLLRLLFIPFFVFCNVNPTSRQLPVIIKNDYVYIIGAILMAFTSGYFSSLTMMYAPSGLTEPKHQEVAGMVAAFFLVLGIFCGVTFSIPLTTFIENVGGGGVGGDGTGISDFSEGIFNFTTIASIK